jgi:hypothetical protein
MMHERRIAAAGMRGDAVDSAAVACEPGNRLSLSESAVAELSADAGPGTKRQRAVQAYVARLLEGGSASPIHIEKRAHRRFPFRRSLVVTPINGSTGRPDRTKSFPAFGIDISATGVCFLGRQLVPARTAVLSIDGPDGQMVHMLFEPRWVRFTRGGWYQTGGRLLEVLPHDTEPVPNLRILETPPDIDELCESSRQPH